MLHFPKTVLNLDYLIGLLTKRLFLTAYGIGYIPKIINIPSKPTLEGFKIWILTNKGYILDFIWHAKGDKKGLVNLDKFFINKGFSKTQAVVLDLLF